MRSFVVGLLMVVGISSANAVPVTYIDLIDPNPNRLMNSEPVGNPAPNRIFSFTHSILDDGYNALADTITGAAITLRFSDESTDAAAESVSFTFDLLSFGTQTITSGGAIFPANFSGASLIALVVDGLLNVTLDNAGLLTTAPNNRSDFLFLDSTLTVDVERSLVPPFSTGTVSEPHSVALVGLALVGLLLRRRLR
jgi:hypothetical protein